jgi:DNA-binding XRE family transcriptional regulator
MFTRSREEEEEFMEKKNNAKEQLFNSITFRSVDAMAQALKRVRKLHRYSQTELAKKTGLTQATISRVESGSKKVEIGTLILIFAALNADLVITPRLKSNVKNSLEGLF